GRPNSRSGRSVVRCGRRAEIALASSHLPEPGKVGALAMPRAPMPPASPPWLPYGSRTSCDDIALWRSGGSAGPLRFGTAIGPGLEGEWPSEASLVPGRAHGNLSAADAHCGLARIGGLTAAPRRSPYADSEKRPAH